MSQCWAFNKAMQRCEKDAGHENVHMVSSEWDDTECYDPMASAVAFTTTEKPIPIFEIPMNGPCEGCGCSEAAHEYDDEDGERMFSCEKHDCREYIP